VGTPGHAEIYDGKNHEGEDVHLEGTRTLAAGEKVDLTPDIQENYKYFTEGPGYSTAG